MDANEIKLRVESEVASEPFAPEKLNHYQAPKTSGLRRFSTVCIVLGYIAIVLGIVLIIATFNMMGDSHARITFEPYLAFSMFGGSWGMLFYGYVGEAIDDIRKNIKN